MKKDAAMHRLNTIVKKKNISERLCESVNIFQTESRQKFFYFLSEYNITKGVKYKFHERI